MDNLMAGLVRQVRELLGFVRALVPYSEQSVVQDCYDYGRVLNVEYREDGVLVEAELIKEMREKLERYEVPGSEGVSPAP